MAKGKKLTHLQSLEMQINWFHDFADCVQSWMPNTYDKACERADDIEKERLSNG